MAGRADQAAAEGRVAVVIPAFQAAETLVAVIAAVRRTLPAAAVYVVDDGSTDGTGDFGRGTGAKVVRLAGNRGKGAALAAGIACGLNDGATVFATLDADGQHDPASIPRLLEPITFGEADLVLGARPRIAAMPAGRRFNNWLSSALATRVGRDPIPDAQTGFRAFRRVVAEAVRPQETRYDYELAFLLGALAAGYRVRSVPVPTIYDGAASHFRALADTWRLACVFARYSGKILMGTK